MSEKPAIVLEGSYHYFQKDVNYSLENFKLVQTKDLQTSTIHSEILSRVESGEFLKIIVKYEMNAHHHPVFVRVEKSLGNRYALETFKHDLSNQELHYTFQNTESTQEFTRSLSAKHYLASPAFASSMAFTMTKKFDPTGRTGVSLLSANNEWTYEHPPTEKIIHGEYKNRDLEDYRVSNAPLSASHLCLYESDTTSKNPEIPVDVYLSKHHGIPYELVQGDLRIVIKSLKKNDPT